MWIRKKNIDLISYAAKTHQGPYLKLNEDDYSLDLRNRLFMAFDGFGGSGIGDKAVRILKEASKKFYTNFSRDPDSTMPFYFNSQHLLEGNALINAMKYAHEVLLAENATKEMSERGASSVIAASLAEGILNLFLVGNCMAFLFRKKKLSLLCSPDILSPLDSFDESSGAFHESFSTYPLGALGMYSDLYFHFSELKIKKDDLVLLMTDGLYLKTQAKDLELILKEKEIGLGDKLKRLFDIANDSGNADNQTGLILQF